MATIPFQPPLEVEIDFRFERLRRKCLAAPVHFPSVSGRLSEDSSSIACPRHCYLLIPFSFDQIAEKGCHENPAAIPAHRFHDVLEPEPRVSIREVEQARAEAGVFHHVRAAPARAHHKAPG